MATEPSSQRAYRAACPNCGAPVEFRSAASAFAVCSYCRSTVVREGGALRKIGQSAELFDDHSPLQLGAAGKRQGVGFTLVGRLQYRSSDATWNEWHALFDNGRSGWLSEDNGRYVFAFDQPLDKPPGGKLFPDLPVSIGGQGWRVASVVQATLIAAQGELPVRPKLDGAFTVVDLRSPRDEVATLDYSEPEKPRWSIGRSVSLPDLAMTGLSEHAEKTLRGRGVECPSCGSALNVTLSTTQSIACPQCHAVVDVSQGVGGDLSHYAQANGMEPQIPLGTTGTLSILAKGPLPWQVVGYVERCELAQGDDDQSFWREYLLYHRTHGFAFLVDAQDGWSWVAPITGVPEPSGVQAMRYQGHLYRKMYEYTAKITYVLGEFYWKLERDQLTENTDYTAGSKRLNQERTRGEALQEIVWSAGETLTADAVLKAFRLAPEKAAALQRDATPASDNAASMLAKVFFWAFVIIVLLMLFRCSDDDCDQLRDSYGAASSEYRNCVANRSSSGWRTGGGSFGGYSSGGGHK